MTPERITIDGIDYEVNVERNNEEIVYFNLSKVGDKSDDIFLEVDWIGDFTEKDILNLVQEEKEREEFNALYSSRSLQESIPKESIDSKYVTNPALDWISYKDLVSMYPYLSEVPKEDLTELIESLYILRDESRQFQNIVVSEWLDTYEELQDGSNPYL